MSELISMIAAIYIAAQLPDPPDRVMLITCPDGGRTVVEMSAVRMRARVGYCGSERAPRG